MVKPSCGLSTEVLAAGLGALAGRQKTGEQVTAQDEKLFCAEGHEDGTGGLQAGSGAWLTGYWQPNASKGKRPVLARGPLLSCCCNNNPCCRGVSLGGEASFKRASPVLEQAGLEADKLCPPCQLHSCSIPTPCVLESPDSPKGTAVC